MRKQNIMTLAAIFAFIAVQAQVLYAEDRHTTPVSANLHGTAYLGFIDLSNEAFAPSLPVDGDETFLPVYFIWGQNGNVLYGALVIPTEKKAAFPPEFLLKQYAIYNGSIAGNTIKFRLDGDKDLTVDGVISGDLISNGDQISLYMNVPVVGRIAIGDLYRCNQNKKISGQYLGSGGMTSSPASTVNNVMMGILIQGSKMSFSAFYYDPDFPDEPGTFSGEASFNPVNGSFQFQGNPALGEPDFTGKIANGILSITISLAEGGTVTATAYFFGQEVKKKTKLKKPKPALIAAGEQNKIRIKHKYGMFGSLLAVTSANTTATAAEEIVIRRYSMSGNRFDIWLDVPNKLKGSFSLIATSPNGKTAKSKRPFEVH